MCMGGSNVWSLRKRPLLQKAELKFLTWAQKISHDLGHQSLTCMYEGCNRMKVKTWSSYLYSVQVIHYPQYLYEIGCNKSDGHISTFLPMHFLRFSGDEKNSKLQSNPPSSEMSLSYIDIPLPSDFVTYGYAHEHGVHALWRLIAMISGKLTI